MFDVCQPDRGTFRLKPEAGFCPLDQLFRGHFGAFELLELEFAVLMEESDGGKAVEPILESLSKVRVPEEIDLDIVHSRDFPSV